MSFLLSLIHTSLSWNLTEKISWNFETATMVAVCPKKLFGYVFQIWVQKLVFTLAFIWWPLILPSFWLILLLTFTLMWPLLQSFHEMPFFCNAKIQFVALWTKFLILAFRMFSSITFTSWQIRAPKVWTHSKHNFCVEIKSLSKLILNYLSKFLEIFASNILLHQILESWKMCNFGCMYCWKDLRCHHEWTATT